MSLIQIQWMVQRKQHGEAEGSPAVPVAAILPPAAPAVPAAVLRWVAAAAKPGRGRVVAVNPPLERGGAAQPAFQGLKDVVQQQRAVTLEFRAATPESVDAQAALALGTPCFYSC